MQLINSTLLATIIMGLASQTHACAFQGTIDSDGYLTSTMKQSGTQTCHLNGYGDNTGYTYDCTSGHSLRCNNSLDKCTYKNSQGTWSFSAGNPTVDCEGTTCFDVYIANPKCT